MILPGEEKVKMKKDLFIDPRNEAVRRWEANDRQYPRILGNKYSLKTYLEIFRNVVDEGLSAPSYCYPTWIFSSVNSSPSLKVIPWNNLIV